MSNENLSPRFDENPADENDADAWTDDEARTDDGAVTEGEADVRDIPASAGPLGDYDAMPDSGQLPDSNARPDFDLPTTSDAGDPADDDKINITEHEGPNLQAGNDLDTGAGGAPQNP